MSSKGERQARRHPASPSIRASDARAQAHAVLGGIQRSADEPAKLAREVRRDDLAFAELYVGYFDRVNRYMTVALKDLDDAQEAAQDVFARALAALDGYDPARGEIRDWLFGIARNVAIDRLRKRSRVTETELEEVPRHALGSTDRAASLLERLDPGAGARSMIAGLPDLQRRVLALRFVFGLETNEICAVLGSTPDAVRHIQHRALKALATVDPSPAAGGAG